MNDMAGTPLKRMQSELLSERVVEALRTAQLPDQAEARDAVRYAARIEFSLRRVEGLRAVATEAQSAFVEGRLSVALTILEGHVVHAANFIDGIARRSSSELARVNRRIAGAAATGAGAAPAPEAQAVRAA